MLVEFIGGPRDGQQIEMPEGSTFVELAVNPHLHRWPQGNGDIEPVGYDTLRLYISTAPDGRKFVVWREG